MADKKTKRPSESQKGEKSPEQKKDSELQLEAAPGRSHKRQKWENFFISTYFVLTVATAILAVTLIAVSTMSAIAAGGMDTHDSSGRIVALVVLAVSGAVVLAMIIYAQIATCTKKFRPIFVAAIVLLVLALIQVIVAGASVKVSEKDQGHITQGLAESFQQAKQHSPRHAKIWASTQHTLRCCGLYGPFDYRAQNSPPYLAPDVPISCCPSYDPNRSELVQEREREICKNRNDYYEGGCSAPVLQVIRETSLWSFNIAITLVILEILSSTFGLLMIKYKKRKHGLFSGKDEEAK